MEATTSSSYTMRFGTRIEADGAITFRLFAPAEECVRLRLEGQAESLAMAQAGDGWHQVTAGEAHPGSLYRFVLADGTEVPDPASRYQPQDVAGPSEVIDPEAYRWHDQSWTGDAWHEVVLYELHIGTFTQQGTLAAAVDKLDHLVSLGVTAVELMCLSDFAGNRNWGYDEALLFACDSAYGRPEELKGFIDAAHRRKLMVILDVVYNHFGPEGNYLGRYFPEIESRDHQTPWGQALNFDGNGSAEVREFIIANALYWIEEFHVDGLRLDASHQMIDESPYPILEELRDRVNQATRGRKIHLILEDEHNRAKLLARGADGRPQGYTAQWNHDITHLLAAVLGKPCEERLGDDQGETERLGTALTKGFVLAAEDHGDFLLESTVPPTAFIAFIQTHDLVGNRIFGERISHLTSPEAVRAISAVYLLLPQIPMIFMGEEWGASSPFPFFCDYHGALAEQVREGRCRQLEQQDPKPSAEELKRAPNPQAEETLRSAQLRWEELSEPAHGEILTWFQQVLRVRKQRITPLLEGLTGTCGSCRVLGPGALEANWELAGGSKLRLASNLCAQARDGFSKSSGEVLWIEGSEAEGTLGPWSVRWAFGS